MKKTIKFSLILLSLILSLSSCMKDTYDTPSLYEPIYTGDKTHLISIASLKAKCASSLQLIDSTFEITGIVVANDESGNLYKVLEIQDATGGIEVMLNQTSLYNTYKVGQRVYISCKGMYLGTYGGVVKLGDNNSGAIGQLAATKIKSHVYLDGFPLPSNTPTARVLTSTTQINDSMINTLVTLNNVSFADGGSDIYAENQATSKRTMNLSDGTTVIAYNSGYASFQADSLPQGKGNVTGVLTKYVTSSGTTYEILIRNLSDVSGFVKSIISESFTAGLGKFTTQSVTGDQVWAFSSSFKCATMSGYNSTNKTNYANEDWLISPAFDLSSQTSAHVSFSHSTFSTTSLTTQLTFWVSTDYDGTNFSSATWTQLIIPVYPILKYVFVSSGNMDLSPYLGKSNVHVAFKYVSTTSNANTWELNNVLIEK
ncbi:MAG: DUF5689 domain-containing protein [Paludibacteraceae bacterium]|nr:DUF5689 domain-containing protein [Paludibacteraceae bacterium]